MEKETKKINRSIKIYPLFASFTGDLIFFVPIDTLFLTLVKGLNASQITAMTMVALIICIVFQKIILAIVKKIGNVNSLRLGAMMLIISSLLLTFGKTFIAMLLYKSIHELAVMFLNMDEIILKNNLKKVDRRDDYFKIRNKSKIIYSIITLFTALVAGEMFNIDHYLPMYLSIIIYVLVLGTAFLYYEAKTENEEVNKEHTKIKTTTIIFYIMLSNAVFYSIIKMGQNNSKLLVGNIIFGKIYLKIKDKMSIVLTICLALAFTLLITGHFINSNFVCKVIIMSLGFFLILAIRDSFQTYIEDVALTISNKDEQQDIIIKIEVYRRVGTLILSAIFTLILMKYELIVIEFILLLLSIVEIFINKQLCDKLANYNKKVIE